METIDQIIDASFTGLFTPQIFIRHLRQRLQTVANPTPCGLTEQQFESAYSENAGYIKRVLANAPPDMIEDLAQETWLRAWEKRKQYRGDRASAKTWLCNIARNVLIDYQRKNSTAPRLLPLPNECGDDPLENDMASTPSGERLTNLRQDLGVILTIDDMKLLPLLESGMTGREMAITLQITEKACESRVMRLRRRIHKYLAG